MSTQVVIYDNHPIILYGLTHLLSNMDYTIICSTTDASNFIYQVESNLPDVVILDPMNLPEGYFEKLCRIKRVHSKIRLFVLASSDSVYHLIRGHRLDIQGYLSKSDEVDLLIMLLEKMKSDKLLLISAPGNIATSASDAELLLKLTNRELQILRELAAGKTNKMIAEELLLSSKTISTYKRSIMHKLHTQKIRDVIDFARRNGF